QVADRGHFGQVHADGDQRLGDFGGEAGDDDGGAQEPRRFDRLHQVVRDVRVHGGPTGAVDDDDFRAVGADGSQQLLGELPGALGVDDADDGQNEEPFANLKHR